MTATCKLSIPSCTESSMIPRRSTQPCCTRSQQKAGNCAIPNARFFGEQAVTLVAAAKALAGVYRGGGRLFSMGNGGSSCDASHIAVEFVHPITAGRPALAAINLVADLAMISAVGNDVGFEHVFVRQVMHRQKPRTA